MDFRLEGRDEVYSVECLVRTGWSHMCLFALDDFESLEPPEEEGTDPELPVQVVFRKNYIKFGGKRIPLHWVYGMPVVMPEIVSGSTREGKFPSAKAVAASCGKGEEVASYEYVHRILAHAGH